MHIFVARAGAAEELEDLGAFVVVLAEGRDGAGARLEFQRALVFDAADVAAGMDTYCLCTADGACHYGGVRAWTMSTSALRVSLDPAAAEALGLGREVEIPLALPAEVRAVVERGLARVIGAPQTPAQEAP